MDFDYHIRLVQNDTGGYERTEYDWALVARAAALYPQARTAMVAVLEDGDYGSYVTGIESYDRFVWEQSHKGDKSNIFAYKKIKVSPSWTEQLWAPVFERVRTRIADHWANEDLVTLQNTPVVESLSHQGPSGSKVVDGGVAIKVDVAESRQPVHMPIVVSEHKTGHFCKTACTGVDAIIRRVKVMNPKVLALAITDDHVSVGKSQTVDNVFGSGGVLISQRGSNGRRTPYPRLHASRLQMVETLCVRYLKTMTATDFTAVRNVSSRGECLRASIDQNGYFVPGDLRRFLS